MSDSGFPTAEISEKLGRNEIITCSKEQKLMNWASAMTSIVIVMQMGSTPPSFIRIISSALLRHKFGKESKTKGDLMFGENGID